MNNKPFVRKIIYIALIGALIIPLSFISGVQTRDADGGIDKPGGVLAQLREKHDLSQAKMSDIDPASETMKLASLGLRGVAVNVLWMQAAKHQKNEDYNELSSTLKLLTKIQPNFVKVWEYQAHNLAYNISMEFDDYEQRYTYVKRGLVFLKEGIPHNKRDHRMSDNMGFFTGNKFGKSDEKKSFRRLFRTDTDFHGDMSDFFDPDLYDSQYGHDSWKMAYLWYDYSRKLVEEKNCRPYRSDVMFYQFRPSQLRNQAISLQSEFPPSSFMKKVWSDADEGWREYGNKQLRNSLGVIITLEGQNAAFERIKTARAKLDKLVPGVRAEAVNQFAQEVLTPEERALIKTPSDQLSEQDVRQAELIRERLEKADDNLDANIALKAKVEDRAEALELVKTIKEIESEINAISRDAATVNYPYWRTRNFVESQESTLFAHQALAEAEAVWKKSTYDDEYEFNYRTKEKKIIRKGAITLYEEAFDLWAPILEENPDLKEGQLADRLVQSIRAYQMMLRFANREWPMDFPLQTLIDDRFQAGEADGIPTTEYLNRLRGIEVESGDQSDEIGGKRKEMDPNIKSGGKRGQQTQERPRGESEVEISDNPGESSEGDKESKEPESKEPESKEPESKEPDGNPGKG